MTITEKADFLRKDFVPLLRSIAADTAPLWGKMNLQQMTEHFGDAVRMSSGVLPAPRLFTAEADLPKMRAFLASDKAFSQNIPNPLVPQTPPPVRFASFEAALEKLQKSIDQFFSVFETNAGLTTLNPFFGHLSFEENVQLLYKHALHHLGQFGVEV